MAVIKIQSLKDFLDNYLYFDKSLDLSKIDPYMANGLMVKGKEDIKKIGFGVSASHALFEKALDTNCDAIIVHHAFNLPPFSRFDELFQTRIGFLLKNKISLFGYHFLLDTHPEIGNNVQILKTIGAKPTSGYLHRGAPWGWVGEFEKERDLVIIEEQLKPFLSPRSVTYRFGSRAVKKIVAISGKGAPIASDMQYLQDSKIDLYITGEVHEWNREMFREAKINFIAGGHYNTEKFGVKALMENVKNNFPEVEVEWLELENEV